MVKFVAKVMDKLLVPIVILNIAAIGSVFYTQGKLDAMKDIEMAPVANVLKETAEV